MANLSTDILDLFDELDDVDDDLNDEDEESWILVVVMVATCHGINYYYAEACCIAPYTNRLLVLEFLKIHQWRRCREVLRMPWHMFKTLVYFFINYTGLDNSKYLLIEEKLIIFLVIIG
jgi:hypothetical protein